LSLVPIDLRPRLLQGDGSLRREFLGLVDQLGLQKFVKLVGYVENPLKYFRNANTFVLPSHVEGLPNVLVEAMMRGYTPVATGCPIGPREVLQGGRFGCLVPVGDPAAMANAIVNALESPIAVHALEEAVGPFSETKVLQHHFKTLGYCVKHEEGA
jgi:glycosyltransferase involved in cell wall biosynthesis